MDDSVQEFLRSRPERPRDREPEPNSKQIAAKREMSRGAQTAWIVGTLVLMGIIALGFALDKDDPRYPGCTGFFGVVDEQCQVEIAAARLGGRAF